MSTMSEALAAHSPHWTIPEDLERAWLWMEQQGFGRTTPAGYALTPYAGKRQLGAVFLSTLTLEGWREPGAPGSDRLLPIAEVAGDGSIGALWLDDEGRTRVVVLAGSGYVVADDARDFLLLLAVGYDELLSFMLSGPPEDPEPVEAVAGFRAWVEATFGVEVPPEWRSVGDDDFSVWLDAQLGLEEPVAAPVADVAPGPVVTGDVRAFLDVLGEQDGPETARRVAEVAGVDVEENLRASAGPLRSAGIEVSSDRHGVCTIWIAVRGAVAYPRAAQLIDGLDEASTLDDALRLLGAPERRGGSFLRYLVGGRYLHLEFADDSLARVTLMVEAP